MQPTLINPFYANRSERQKPAAMTYNGPVYAKLPRAPMNASPVPHLTSLYHFSRAGEYGDRGYPGNCGGNLIKDLLRYFKPRSVFDPMTGSGTCRDFALLMMEAVRSLGFAARFVTGYVYVPDRDVADRDGPDRDGADADKRGGGATHAWCEVYLPGAGWVDFDPTNGIVGNRDLIRVAVARDPSQAVPLGGSFFGGAEDFTGMSVQVNVTTEPATTPLAAR